jgi:hypothetical protein
MTGQRLTEVRLWGAMGLTVTALYKFVPVCCGTVFASLCYTTGARSVVQLTLALLDPLKRSSRTAAPRALAVA